LTQLEQKLCSIYLLADKIRHEPTVSLWPQTVSLNQVSEYAELIKDAVLVAMDEVAHLVHKERLGSPQ
jgi:hypothetical protein